MASSDDYDALMRELGVTPLRGQAKRAPRAQPPPEVDRILRAQAQREQARDRQEALTSRVDAGLREAAELHAALEIAARERDALAAERDALRIERDALRIERAALDQERRALQRRLSAAPQAPAAPPSPSLRAALTGRGLETPEEEIEATLTLLGETPEALLDALQAGEGLTELLERRLALVCDRPACQPGAGAVTLRVPPARCEVCEGSDITLAWRDLAAACAAAGVQRIAVIGGSPNYRSQLRSLSRGGCPKLEFVAGGSKPRKGRAPGANADRVIIWGATILDHATSSAYDGLGDRLLYVSHRGISRMLREAAAQIGGG